MNPTHRPDNSRRSHDANNANNTKAARMSRRGFMKRSTTLITAFVVVGVLATGFMVVTGRATALRSYLPASVSSIFASGTTANTAPASRTIGAPSVEPLAPLAVETAWDFSPLTGGANNFGASPLAPTSSDANVTAGGLTRGAGIGTTGTGAANAWGGNDFTIASPSQATAITNSEFATFTITANAGFTVSLSDIAAYNIRRSGTGPTTGIWQYQIGAGAFVDIGSSITWGAITTAAGNPQTAITLSGISALQNVPAGTTITLRVVTWGATSTGGTWYLNDPADTAANDLVANGTTATVGAPPKYRSRQSGSWNDFNTWQIDTGGGFVDAVSGETPSSASDTIQIQTTHTVTVTASVNVDQVTVDAGGGIQVNSGQTLTVADGAGIDLTNNGIVSVAGTIANSGQMLVNNLLRLNGNPAGSVTGNAVTYGASSTLEYSASGPSQITTSVEFPAASGPPNVTINNSSGVTLHAARTLSGTLDLINGTFATGGNLSMAIGSQITKSAGDMTGTPQGAGTYNVVYSGFTKTSGSELDGAGLTNVTVDMNPSQFLSLTGTKTVPGTLFLTNGMVSTGSFTLIANGTVTRNTGFVVGNLQRQFAAASTLIFDVGTFLAYSPVSVNATAGTFPAQFTVSATIGALPGISGPNKLGRYWTLTNTTVASANLTFNYLPSDITGTVANYQFVRKTGGTFTVLPPAGTPTSTSATINGVTAFSDWTLAEPSSVLTTFVVNHFDDTGDVTPGNGICETGTGNGICTLRAAVQEANATVAAAPIDINFNLGGNSIITVSSELQLNHDMNINGPTADSITIFALASAPTRIFHTMPTRTVSISNLLVSGGRAAIGAGLLAEGPASSTTLTGMLFGGNIAVDPSGVFGGGGAATINGGTLNILNSTFSGNTATNGGGLAIAGVGPLNLVNVTVTNNLADGNTGAFPCPAIGAIDGDGGGIAGPTMPGSGVNLRNTIVAGNQDCNSNNPNVSGGFNDQGNNLTSGDPMLNPLNTNGGPTATHSLQVLSPAIDSGNNCVVLPVGSGGCLATPLTFDQRGPGFGRLADGNSNPPAVIDIGAFEKQFPSAAGSAISGRIIDENGNPIAGAAIRMSGTQTRMTVTDAAGNYRFDDVGTGGFYTVAPARANYTFAPAERSFSQLGQHTNAAFTASATGATVSPLDTTEFFVRQQYLDFLGREPDEAGLNFWVNNIASCGADANCLAAKRTDTSAAFFLSIEFQRTGYLVYRFYQSAYGDIPGHPVPINLAEFRPDTAIVGRGVVVNETGWQAKLDANTEAFAVEFVGRSRFVAAYPATLRPVEFVDRLFLNTGVIPEASDRAAAIGEFGNAQDSSHTAARARALLRVADNAVLRQQETNRAFVLMQYFGYLGRDPNSTPDTDFSGYSFWLNKLESFNGDFRRAEMVRAFLVAGEYRSRFAR